MGGPGREGFGPAGSLVFLIGIADLVVCPPTLTGGWLLNQPEGKTMALLNHAVPTPCGRRSATFPTTPRMNRRADYGEAR